MNVIDTNIFSNKEDFLALIEEKLGKHPSDFPEKMHSIQNTKMTGGSHSAAGVLLLLHFRYNDQSSRKQKGEFIFQLIKRSSKVTQPGDLSCPGGLLQTNLDPLLQFLISSRLLPILRGNALKYVQMRDTDTARMITLFLTNAVREAREETGLSPFNIHFLGPLPTYSLLLFRRIIFPLVGFVKREWQFYPNDEVDSLLEIPLMTFFDEKNYGIYRIQSSSRTNADRQDIRDFPCLISHNNAGKEEILWGATFYIILSFLKIVLDFEITGLHAKRIIQRTLEPEYITGYHKNQRA
ncbi:MAG: CoA pyrophosphatase [Syntrophaceae bacterium]